MAIKRLDLLQNHIPSRPQIGARFQLRARLHNRGKQKAENQEHLLADGEKIRLSEGVFRTAGTKRKIPQLTNFPRNEEMGFEGATESENDFHGDRAIREERA